MHKIIAWFVQNPVAANLMMLILVVGAALPAGNAGLGLSGVAFAA